MNDLYEALKNAGAIVSERFPSGWTDRIEKKNVKIKYRDKLYMATLKAVNREADPLVEIASKWHLEEV